LFFSELTFFGTHIFRNSSFRNLKYHITTTHHLFWNGESAADKDQHVYVSWTHTQLMYISCQQVSAIELEENLRATEQKIKQEKSHHVKILLVQEELRLQTELAAKKNKKKVSAKSAAPGRVGDSHQAPAQVRIKVIDIYMYECVLEKEREKEEQKEPPRERDCSTDRSHCR
jgi:hypothetical protein